MVILTLNPSFPGKWIWTLDMLPKIQYFLLKCFLHSIPTKDILESRGLVGDVKCQLACNGDRQFIIHVLRDCLYAKCFWDNTQACTFVHEFYSLDLCSWLEKNYALNSSCNNSIPWEMFFFFEVWMLWLHRNNVVFKSSPFNCNLYREVQAVANEFLFCASRSVLIKRRQHFQVRWNKREFGWMKFNGWLFVGQSRNG